MSALDRIACLRTLQQEWESMPEGNPQRRERWFEMVGTEIAALPTDADRIKWINLLALTLHDRQPDLPMSVCIEILLLRIKAAQKGGGMYRKNVRRPVASSGTAEELLGVEDVALNDFIPDECARHDRLVLIGALLLGLLVVCLAFWPALLGWMTEFRYGVVVGMVSAAVLIVGALAIGVCLGAGRLEKSK